MHLVAQRQSKLSPAPWGALAFALYVLLNFENQIILSIQNSGQLLMGGSNNSEIGTPL